MDERAEERRELELDDREARELPPREWTDWEGLTWFESQVIESEREALRSKLEALAEWERPGQ